MLKEFIKNLSLTVIESIYTQMEATSFGGDTSGAEEYLRQANESLEIMLKKVDECEKEVDKPCDYVSWGDRTRDDNYDCGGEGWRAEKYRRPYV
jgi:hypothetical protein